MLSKSPQKPTQDSQRRRIRRITCRTHLGSSREENDAGKDHNVHEELTKKKKKEKKKQYLEDLEPDWLSVKVDRRSRKKTGSEGLFPSDARVLIHFSLLPVQDCSPPRP